MMRFVGMLPLLLTVGCATTLPPVEATYDKQPSITTSLTAKVTFTTGSVNGTIVRPWRMIQLGSGFAAINSGQPVDARFGPEDQEDAQNLLGATLVEARVIGARLPLDSSVQPDLTIKLDFLKTDLVHQNLFYVLDVRMSIQGLEKHMERIYHIDVHEADSTAERWNSTFPRNKIKAKKMLLNNAIPDIETFLKERN